MAKGTYRLKRLAVLEELEGYDAAWAQQIRELRTSNPQAYRKELLKADVVLSAATGRKTTLSMRPKRFGGEEDPQLVRRVLALRKAYPELTRGVVMSPVFGRPTPDFEESDLGAAEGWTQERTPAMDASDLGSVEGWTQDRTPSTDKADLGSVEGWTQHRTPSTDKADLGAVEGWTQQRTPTVEGADVGQGSGVPPRGRAPEMSERPQEDLSAPKPQTRQARERPGPRPMSAGSTSRATVGASSGPDLSVLKGTVSAFKSALATGDLDQHLDALEAAEKAGKGRRGVLSAIAARR